MELIGETKKTHRLKNLKFQFCELDQNSSPNVRHGSYFKKDAARSNVAFPQPIFTQASRSSSDPSKEFRHSCEVQGGMAHHGH